MKKKILNKKLTFTKETVTNLNEKKMTNIKGGYTGNTCQNECWTNYCDPRSKLPACNTRANSCMC